MVATMKHKQACIILPLLASLIACSGYQNIYHADDYEVDCAAAPLKLKSDMALSTVQPVDKPHEPVDLDAYIIPEIWRNQKS